MIDELEKNKHKIPPHITNSTLRYCIDEYVRLERDREILRDKWFGGLSIEKLADKYKIAETSIKAILYGIGDEILLKACEIDKVC